MLIATVLACSSLSLVMAQPAGSGNVHGTVIKEDGKPLSGVKITAYSSAGNLGATFYTDSEGYFRIALYAERYTLYFEKAGYVTKQYSITVPAGFYFETESDPVKMGTIVMEPSLGLSASVLSRVVSPGETVSFPFTVSISGNEPEMVEFSVEAPEGWATRILDSTGEIRKALLSAGSLPLTLEVTVPETANEAGDIKLTVIGSTEPMLEFAVLPYETPQRDVDLSAKYTYISAELGGSVSFPITISNDGDTDEAVSLLGLVPEEWTVTFITGSQVEVLSIFLNSGESESLTFEAEPSVTAQVGVYLLEVQALDGESEVMDSLELRLSLKEKTEGEVEIISTFTDVSVEAGSVLRYPLTVWNKGDSDDLFMFTVVSAPSEWDVTFKSGDVEISSLLISAGGFASITFEVTPPSDYEIGSYDLIVMVESEDEGLRDSLILGVNLRELSTELEIISTYTDVTIQAGGTIAFPLRIVNHGETDSRITLSVASAPENWDTIFTSDGVEISSFYIGAGESQNIKLEVEPPRMAETGEYSMLILAVSDDGSMSEEIKLKATVIGSYSVNLELSTLYTTTPIGSSLEFTARVINNGNSPITTLYLENTVPDDWEITASPSQFSTLAPMESTTFTLVVETPSDTVAGDYLITMKAVFDQAESDEVDLRVTAQASTSWGFIGIGLAGVVIIGLVIAFTRFKRR